MTTKLDLVLWTWTHFLKLFYTRAQRRECLRICPNARKSYGLHVACIAITAVILGWTLMLTLATVLDSISVVCVSCGNATLWPWQSSKCWSCIGHQWTLCSPWRDQQPSFSLAISECHNSGGSCKTVTVILPQNLSKNELQPLTLKEEITVFILCLSTATTITPFLNKADLHRQTPAINVI